MSQQPSAQPTAAPPQQAAPPTAAAAALSASAPVGPPNPYHAQGYGLPNVDMSSFQGVDWSMYGMGMYV